MPVLGASAMDEDAEMKEEGRDACGDGTGELLEGTSLGLLASSGDKVLGTSPTSKPGGKRM